MDINILTLTDPLEVNLSIGKYKSDHLKPSQSCPPWAEETLKAYLAFTVQSRRRSTPPCWASPFFTRLAVFADQRGQRDFAGISAELIKDFIKTVNYGCHAYQQRLLTILKQLILWLVAVDLLPAGVFKELYLTGKQEQWFNETEARFGVKTAANDLMDLNEQSLCRLEVPAWAVEAIEQYAKSCSKGVSTIFSSAHQSVVNSAAYIRSLVRHYEIQSFHDLKPSHLAELGLSLRPLGYYFKCFSHFVQFLARHAFIPEYMPKAFLGVKQIQFLFPTQTDWSDYPPGELRPEELYQYRNQIYQILVNLGYTEHTLTSAMSGFYRHCLFLQEHGLRFSFKGAVQWCEALSSFGTVGSYKTGLYLGHKILCHEPVTPDIMLEERYCQLRCNPKNLPAWSEDWCQRYLKQRRQDGMSESTLRIDLINLRYLVEYLDKRKINAFNSLTPELLHDFDRDCNPGGARYKAEINRKIRQFLLFLAENGVVTYTLILALPTYSVGKVRPVKILTKEQLQEVYRFCSEASGECQTRDALAFKLALNLGLRAVDIVTLRFDAIDVKKNILRFRQRKTGRIVELPLPQTVLNALFEYLSTRKKEHPNEQVMLRSRAPHCKLKSADGVRQRANGLNCDHFTLHQLRKTFASLLLRSGVNFQLIADALGHANAETVHVYLSTDTEMLRSCCFPSDGFELNAEGVL